MAESTANRSLIAGAMAAVAASVCCVGPLVLLGFGISGAWIGNLTELEPYRSIFSGLTLMFLGLAFRKLYLVPRSCNPGASCAGTDALKRQRLTFWIVTILLFGLLAVPFSAPLFY
ncbi:mercury transporter MerT [Beijerinckiaceae bacterium]|nr:mercury transporter MerT [Beijerinckiaceae bacterium]